MPQHERFNFPNLDELRNKIAELDCHIELREELLALANPVPVGCKVTPNSIAILPMEGCDCDSDGTPTDLTRRRYLRFARGGAGLLWWEACTVVPEGRANPFHMMLTAENAEAFTALVREIKRECAKQHAGAEQPLHILQLTHAGRYSRPEGHKMTPIISHHDPILDSRIGIDESYPLVTDTYLDDLPRQYVKAALLAQECGFDGVDIKACHRYLIGELLASHHRRGKYGGSFENRSRLLLNIVKEVKKAVSKDFILAVRLNVYDAHPYPFGFGVKPQEGSTEFDFNEPLLLAKQLVDCGVQLIGTSAGNPYSVNPYVPRPFDTPALGAPTPPEHPLKGVERLFELTHKIQRAVGDIPVVGSGYSWLREFAPLAGAANLALDKCSFVGLGRLAFAYPDAPKEMLSSKMNPEKVCVTCSKCTQIMRDHGQTGCVIRDHTVYAPLFKEAREAALRREEKKT